MNRRIMFAAVIVLASLAWSGYRVGAEVTRARRLDREITTLGAERELLNDVIAEANQFKAEKEVLEKRLATATEIEKTHLPARGLVEFLKAHAETGGVKSARLDMQQLEVTGHTADRSEIAAILSAFEDSQVFTDIRSDYGAAGQGTDWTLTGAVKPKSDLARSAVTAFVAAGAKP